MKVESVDPNDHQLLDLHIKVLQKILLQEPFDQIEIHYQQNMNDLNYIEIIKNSGKHFSSTKSLFCVF